jgi:hypothetical protein
VETLVSVNLARIEWIDSRLTRLFSNNRSNKSLGAGFCADTIAALAIASATATAMSPVERPKRAW